MSDDDRPSPTPRYQRVLEASAGIARAMGHSYLGVEHVFLAIIQDKHTVPTRVLSHLTDLAQVETSLRETMASPEYNGAPPPDAVWMPVSELRGLLKALVVTVPPGIEWGFNFAGDQAWLLVGGTGDATQAAIASARAHIERERPE
jgi:Clp amino terminal domain, pathogenicity island component